MSFGPGEIVVIVLILLLLFGSRRIADIGKGVGDGIRNFRRGLSGESEGNTQAEEVSDPKQLPVGTNEPRRSPVGADVPRSEHVESESTDSPEVHLDRQADLAEPDPPRSSDIGSETASDEKSGEKKPS